MNIDDLKLYEKKILSCPLFKGISSEELAVLFSSDEAVIIHYPESTVLDAQHMYIILAGQIIIEKAASDGRFVTMGTAVEAAVVNAASVFLQASPMSRLNVSPGSILLQLGCGMLKKALERGGAFSINMVMYLSGRISFLNKKISYLAGYSATSRLLAYLHENAVDGVVIIPTSLSAFADFLGVGRASLYRTLDQLEGNGTIHRKGRKITIIDDYFQSVKDLNQQGEEK